MITTKRGNKFRAKKCKIDGITFDSLKEGRFYNDLKLKKKLGLIESFDCHVRIPAVINGKVCFTYVADFEVVENGVCKYYDVKGLKKGSAYAHFRTKKAVIEALHRIEIIEV